MAELQRSAVTFRRSGSSGLVWGERFLSDGEACGGGVCELRRSQSVGSTPDRRSRGEGGSGEGRRQAFRAAEVPPAADPPSPDVRGCDMLCGIFGTARHGRRSKPRRR
ncbi:uncharacterized protein LOC122004806 [Zingiber officinale]|uniref:uncharacterized protein LOC122004806 n=1 Tax=Zingiber officinale TaxID=94328 RepID=UPI001C4D03D8|nr:uncharacterized protein LOC122004806 [Zingiber officinale]